MCRFSERKQVEMKFGVGLQYVWTFARVRSPWLALQWTIPRRWGSV